MKAILRIQLKPLLNIRMILFGLMIGFLLGLIQALLLNHELLIRNVHGNIIDFFLFSMGGWRNPMSILAFIQCLAVILLVLLVSQWSYTNASDIMLVVRYKNRIVWWLSQCFSQLLICVLTSIVLIVGHLIAGWLFFEHRIEWGIYSSEQYSLTDNQSIPVFLIIAFLILLSGLYVLILLQMTMKIVFKSESAPIALFLLMIPLGFAYIYNHLPRSLSPLFYPSFTSSIYKSIESALFLNVGLALLFIGIGILLIRVREII